MAFDANDPPSELTRAEVEQLPGQVLLEFGTGWCGYCMALAPQLAALVRQHPEVRHVKIEDGKGKPLGRSFQVKLWPTLVFLRDGKVVRQMSRPDLKEVRQGFEALAADLSPG